jgi:putative membrane protein
VERCLVRDLAVQHRLDREHFGRKGLECDGQLLADPTLDVNLVLRRRVSSPGWTCRTNRRSAENERASPLLGERLSSGGPHTFGRIRSGMRQILLSWAANAVVLAVATAILGGVTSDSAGALIKAAALFGILNTVLKPVLRLLSLPLAVITLGLIWFGVAMLMLLLTSLIVDGFAIHGLGALISATIVAGLVNVVLDFAPGPWRGTRRD